MSFAITRCVFSALPVFDSPYLAYSRERIPQARLSRLRSLPRLYPMAKHRNTGRNALILALARQMGIKDPKAALAVASAEGLAGGIGDSGTSFGPWQLHAGGALPRGINNPHQWAWSQAGLKYALSQIKKVAGNRTGADAIANIVRAALSALPLLGNEIQRALAFYQGGWGWGDRHPSGPLGNPSSPGPSVGQP